MAILGLVNTESDANWRFKNYRRRVFYQYPNGSAPLTGLLSLAKEKSVTQPEDTDDPEFSWNEKRLSDQRTVLVATTTSLPFTAVPATGITDSDTADGGATLTLSGFSAAASDSSTQLLRFRVADNSMFRAGQLVKIPSMTFAVAGAGTFDLVGVVTLVGTNNRVNIRALKPNLAMTGSTTIGNLAADVGKEVWVIGSAFVQGQDSLVAQGTAMAATTEIYNLPVNIANYCQIFRTPFSFSGTVLKTGLKYDASGPYKDKAKEASMMNAIELEKSFIFGVRSKSTVAGNPHFTTGGILWFLQQWEAADSVYRGGTGVAAITLDTQDEKRIITNAGGTINEKSYDGYLERVFRVTNNTANEKLVLCGSGFLQTLNSLYKSKTVLSDTMPAGDTYGASFVKHKTPFGDIYYKTHPLFSQNPTLRYNGLFLDMGNLCYRYMQGRDVDLYKMRQGNNEDRRLDEFLGECGLELRIPESFMYLQNVRDYTP